MWPRVYRPTRKQQLFVGGMGVLLAAGGVACFGVALFTKPPTVTSQVLVILCGVLFAPWGAYGVAAILHKRVRLFVDAIELVDLGYRTRHLRRDDIAGIRVIPQQYGFQQFVFEMREPGKKPVKTDLYCERDEVLVNWLAGLPNLDLLDQQRAVRELLERPELGASEDERRHALEEARPIARVATIATVAAGAWGLFYPRPYPAAMLMLAVIPIVATALVLGGRGRYAIAEDRNEVRASLSVPLCGPGIVLAMRALVDFRVVDWQRPLVWTLLASIAVTLLVVARTPAPRRRWSLAPNALLFSAFYVWGALNMANALLGDGKPVTHRVAVVDKHIASGKGPNHHLHLAPWGPFPEGEEVTVSRELYRSVEVGSTVCVMLRSGALGFRSSLVRACDDSAGR